MVDQDISTLVLDVESVRWILRGFSAEEGQTPLRLSANSLVVLVSAITKQQTDMRGGQPVHRGLCPEPRLV